MASIFDGMAGVLNDVFGAPVSITPVSGPAREIMALFREGPVIVGQGEAGDVLDVLPTLRVPKPEADLIKTGDHVAPGNGRTYQVLNATSSGSPGADAFELFQLEEI